MRFTKTLAKYGYTSYANYLQSGHWLDFRKRYRASGLPQRCAVCPEPSYDLHHKTYVRIGCEQLTDVVPLCRDCHKEVHRILDARRWPVEKTDRVIDQMLGKPKAKRIKKAKKSATATPKQSPGNQPTPCKKKRHAKSIAAIKKLGIPSMSCKKFPKHIHQAAKEKAEADLLAYRQANGIPVRI
jgi:hypothetical protein